VNGVRYRLSLDTADWREAQSREKEKILQASTGKLAPSDQQFGRLAFSEAADRYLAGRKLELSPESLEKERWLLVAPRNFFGTSRVSRLTIDDLRAFREERARAGISPAYINMEIGAIRRILKRARRWHLFAEDIKPLKEHSKIGRALSQEERARLLRMAASRPDWEVACCAGILALNTTMRGCELKGLRWRDVNLLDSAVTVRRSKTEAGERVIPLNADAQAAILELYKRAQAFQATELHHYIFPACENGRINATRPQKSWRTAWRHLTREAGLAGLRFHDLRHHAITELAEGRASDQVIRSIAGHVSQRMLEHYSHVRLEAKRKALEALSGEARYGTKHVTNGMLQPKPEPQVVEKNGRPVGTRTPDLYRVNYEVRHLKPFACLAFPFIENQKKP
jgi:integrase